MDVRVRLSGGLDAPLNLRPTSDVTPYQQPTLLELVFIIQGAALRHVRLSARICVCGESQVWGWGMPNRVLSARTSLLRKLSSVFGVVRAGRVVSVVFVREKWAVRCGLGRHAAASFGFRLTSNPRLSRRLTR